MAKASHYVNNGDLLKAIIQYKKDVKEAKREGKPKPVIPDYVGKCLLLIAENLAHKPNFNGFTWKEDMIGDGIENCIMYFDNFDPKKSKNPFAYFTQIIYYAFLRRILKEKKQLYAKYKATEHHGVLGDMEQHENDDGTTAQFELYENISDFIGRFEEAKERKKKDKKVKLDIFLEDQPPTLDV
jgi:hypothetical protein